MLARDLLLLTVVVGVVFVILDVGFVALTRLPNPKETYINPLIRLIRPFLFVYGQLFWYIVVLAIVGLVLIGIPNSPLKARYPELRSLQDAMQKPIPDELAYVPLVAIMMFNVGILGSIWMAVWAFRRLDNKIWDDPGDAISRAMRKFQIIGHDLSWFVFNLVGLTVVFIYFSSLVLHGAADIPVLLDRVTAGDTSQRVIGLLVVVGAFVIGIPLFLVLRILFRVIQSWRRLSWATTDATISSGWIDKRVYTGGGRSGGGVTYTFNTTYNYTVDGKEYKGSHIQLMGQDRSHVEAWLLSKRFPVAATVPVYYNPEQPDQALLIRGLKKAAIVNNLLFMALMVSVALVVVAVLLP